MRKLLARTKNPGTIIVVMSVVAYVATFNPVRAFAGDTVGALSALPVLLAGRYLTRRGTWLVAATMTIVNGVMFAMGGQIVGPTAGWQGALLGTLSLFITAELVGRVRAAEIRLQKSGESKDRFLAGVSHELRTPLTAVVGYSSMLDTSWRDMDETELETITGLLRQQSTEVAFLVEDLLVAARMASEEITFTQRKVRLQTEIEAVLAGLPTPEGSTLIVSGSADARAVGDPGRIRQILRNLVTNAYRYGGPRIALHVVESNAAITLTVADDGRPLARDEWESVFDPYYRSHSRSGQPDSVGLGLTVSRQLARAMGGDLTYRAVNNASVFSLTLPAVQGSRVVASSPEPTLIGAGA